MTRQVGTDDGSEEPRVMPLDSADGGLAGDGGVGSGPHQLHGQVTVGVIACGKQTGKDNERRRGQSPRWWQGAKIMAAHKSDADLYSQIKRRSLKPGYFHRRCWMCEKSYDIFLFFKKGEKESFVSQHWLSLSPSGLGSNWALRRWWKRLAFTENCRQAKLDDFNWCV